jgi:voltage-gated potassium channel
MGNRLREFRANDGFERWESWTAWPLIGLALIFLGVLIVPLAAPMSTGNKRVLDGANLLIWGIFAANYLTSLYLAEQRKLFVRTHVLDLIVVAVPFLRPLRLLRLFAIAASATRRAGGRLVQRITIFAVCTAVVVMSCSAVVVLDAEKRVAGGNIKTFGDAMWWALTTVTTVGYGDRYPVTATGRLMALILMLTGIALVGTVTAAVASWFVNIVRTSATDNAPLAAAEGLLSEQITVLTQTVELMRAELADLRGRVVQS